MEREQRSEGLLRDFIRANCQRMKHELANRDCRLGRYRRDPEAAAAVTPPRLHSRCVKRTHAITPLTHAVSPLTGQIWSRWCQRRRARRSATTSQKRRNILKYTRVHMSPSPPGGFNCTHASCAGKMIFFYCLCAVSLTHSPTIVRT